MAMLTVLFCVGLLALYCIGTYNSLTRLKLRAEEAWSGINVQLKRRYDLVPNLVETVKGYARHESSIFQKVSEARSRAMGASGVAEKADADQSFTGALKTLFAIAESYPELKANTNFIELQRSLETVELEIQFARRYYNGSVREFNIKTQVFPSSLVASAAGFSPLDYFEVGQEERKNPEVKF